MPLKSVRHVAALVAFFGAFLAAPSVVSAATSLKPGALTEFTVELPEALRTMAGRGQLSPVKHAVVGIAVPANIDMAHEWPVLVISATSDPQFRSSRRLMGDYAATALAAGWIIVAADPVEDVTVEQDDVPLRLALTHAALATLASQWPAAALSPLAFGGFSGGAKYSAWLAAAFASQGRTIIGIYMAGINQEQLVAAAEKFNVLDPKFRNIPVFLQAGQQDEIATPDAHRTVFADLKRAGFRRVEIAYFQGAHQVDAAPLTDALDWFRKVSNYATPAP